MKSKDSDTAIVILAAGESKRMGEPKQLLPWGQTTLLGHCISQVMNSSSKHCYVILGGNFEEIYNKHQHFNVHFLEHKKWHDGIGSSIAFAAKNIAQKGFKKILFLLADQPQVNTQYVDHLLEFSITNSTKIIATEYPNGYGIPVCFPEHLFSDLIQISGEKGAKSVLSNHLDELVLTQPEASLEDIDTPEEYRSLYARYH